MIPFLIALVLAVPPTEQVDRCVTRLTEVAERWEWVGLEYDVTLQQCGTENAWYQFADRSVTMCVELCRDVDLAGFILSHELGHAFAHQFNVSVAWGTHDQERFADEAAFFFSERDEVYAAVKWFMDKGRRDDTEAVHPSPHKRAASLLCLDAGAHQDNAMCERMHESVLAHWVRVFDTYWHPPLQP